MNGDDLFDQPLWRPEDLGRAIPASAHAVSVALPQWQDVVGYEERQAEVLDRLNGGYPRFVMHPFVMALARVLGRGMPCVPFPSYQAATHAADFARLSTNQPVEVIADRSVFGVRTTAIGYPALRAFWQHTGLIVSSRQAEACLSGRGQPLRDEYLHRGLRQRLAALYECAEDDVFLTPTGMAAHYYALRAVMKFRPGLPTAQLGFPYVDTLKLQQKLGAGAVFFHDLDRLEADLGARLCAGSLAGAWCEIPGNPLLGSPDVTRLSPLLRQHGVPLVVDDVVATPFNINVAPWADLVATSLTKYLVGTGDVMGGALICLPSSPYYAQLKELVRQSYENLLWDEDAAVLAQEVPGFPERMVRHNASGLFVAEQLRAHPAVENVWYPKWQNAAAYEAVRRPTGGYGSLVTFMPRQAEIRAPAIYNAMELCKGPSLGTVFTLACPFTLLAHYCELDWAESCGVSRYLIRLSIGLENPEEIWARVRKALEV
jgi:cystathionine gamma-synthase